MDIGRNMMMQVLKSTHWWFISYPPAINWNDIFLLLGPPAWIICFFHGYNAICSSQL